MSLQDPTQPAQGVTPISQRACVAIGAAVGVLAMVYTWLVRLAGQHSDFGQIWYSARAVLAGENPYRLIGPGLAYDFFWPLYYPLTASFVAVPFGSMPEAAAHVTWVGVSSALLAYTLARHRGVAALWILCSGAMVRSVALGQWAPILTAALLWPPLRFLYVAKPTVGAGMLAAGVARTPVGAWLTMAIIAGLSLAVAPTWPADWLAIVRTTKHFTAPITRTFVGALLIPLALTRWRRPEARLVFALACVPQTPAIYETLPVLLAAKRWPEYLALTALSSATEVFISTTPERTVVARWARAAPALIYAIYLPAVALILARPNEGEIPAWADRLTRRWPPWLRGHPRAAADPGS